MALRLDVYVTLIRVLQIEARFILPLISKKNEVSCPPFARRCPLPSHALHQVIEHLNFLDATYAEVRQCAVVDRCSLADAG